MRTQRRHSGIVALSVLVLTLLGCNLPLKPTPAPTATSASIGVGGNAGNGQQSTPTPPVTPTAPTPTPRRTPTAQTPTLPTPTQPTPPTPGPTPTVYLGPWEVKQTQVQGDERLSGVVCTTQLRFKVHSTTSTTSFDILFVPETYNSGEWSYFYVLSDLGENDLAYGNYSISEQAPDGSMTVTMSGTDNAKYNGGETNVPIHYTFALVPSTRQC